MERRIFNVESCAKEIIEVLEKHNASIFNMKEVFKKVKQEIVLKIPIHGEYMTEPVPYAIGPVKKFSLRMSIVALVISIVGLIIQIILAISG